MKAVHAERWKEADTDRDLLPGEFEFTGALHQAGSHGLHYGCPHCGRQGHVSFDTWEGLKEDDHRWHWDGNVDAPTLTPSLLSNPAKGGCGWHGFLTAGVWSTV